jgi:hypothetical protein
MVTTHNFDKQFIFQGKAKIWSFVMIAIGIIGISYGFISGNTQRTFANLLLMGYYFVSVCLFGVCFCSVQYIAQAGWSASILRVPQAFVKVLPVAGVILLVIISSGIFITHPGENEAGQKAVLPYLYKLWAVKGVTTPGNINYDAIIAGKSHYLNLPFFFIRLVGYLTFYSLLGRLLVKYSLNEDKLGGMFNYKKSVTTACVFMVLFGFTVPLFAFDVMMSLEAHWFSTLFGWYNLAGLLVTGFTVLTLTIIYLKEAGYLQWVNENHLHTLGKQLFGFSIFWSYLWFVQLLLIWYSNLPEEVVYFYKRWEPEFKFWFWLNVTINFCVPLLAVMSRDAKRKIKTVKLTCIVLIAGHWLDYWLMVMPGTTGPQLHWYTEIGVIEASAFIGFAGMFIYLVLNSLSKFKTLAPKNHPFLKESLHHHI